MHTQRFHDPTYHEWQKWSACIHRSTRVITDRRKIIVLLAGHGINAVFFSSDRSRRPLEARLVDSDMNSREPWFGP